MSSEKRPGLIPVAGLPSRAQAQEDSGAQKEPMLSGGRPRTSSWDLRPQWPQSSLDLWPLRDPVCSMA